MFNNLRLSTDIFSDKNNEAAAALWEMSDKSTDEMFEKSVEENLFENSFVTS